MNAIQHKKYKLDKCCVCKFYKENAGYVKIEGDGTFSAGHRDACSFLTEASFSLSEDLFYIGYIESLPFFISTCLEKGGYERKYL